VRQSREVSVLNVGSFGWHLRIPQHATLLLSWSDLPPALVGPTSETREICLPVPLVFYAKQPPSMTLDVNFVPRRHNLKGSPKRGAMKILACPSSKHFRRTAANHPNGLQFGHRLQTAVVRPIPRQLRVERVCRTVADEDPHEPDPLLRGKSDASATTHARLRSVGDHRDQFAVAKAIVQP